MSQTKHQFAANQAPPSSNSNEIDRLSSTADCESDSERSLGCDKTSGSSPPYKGTPAPFDLQANGISGWTEGPVKSDQKLQPNIKSLSCEMIGDRANATAGEKHEAHVGATTSNDIDGLSLEVEFGSDSEGSLGFDEASSSSPSYTGSPAPFEHQVEGIASWTAASMRAGETRQVGAECLIPSNFEEAKSICDGYRQALEKVVDYESARVDPTNISTVSRRHHLDAIGNPANANATWKRSENNQFGKPTSITQDPYDCRSMERTNNDPEKQASIDVAGAGRRRYHYGGGYTVLVVALMLGILLYGLDMMGSFRCSHNTSP